MIDRPKDREERVMILDECDIDELLGRLDHMYGSLVDYVLTRRRFKVRISQRPAGGSVVVPLHPGYPQAKGPDERGRP